MQNSNPAKNVDDYIAATPKEVQLKLREVRAAIREVAPNAVESISYGMPYYSYKGKSGIKSRLCYFGQLKASIGFYLRPPVIEEHKRELVGYKTTKSAVQLPLRNPMPIPLIKQLVRARMQIDKAGE